MNSATFFKVCTPKLVDSECDCDGACGEFCDLAAEAMFAASSEIACRSKSCARASLPNPLADAWSDCVGNTKS